MEYTVAGLAELSGVSARTLRYYDSIGLLCPGRVTQAGYRVYGAEQVDRLQHVLFYRELGLKLSDIAAVMDADDFERATALRSHLEELTRRRDRLSTLIGTVQNTIMHEEEKTVMKDSEKFEGFKRETLDKNEEKYGDEIRAKYGEDAVESSNAKFMGLSEQQYADMEHTGKQLQAMLEKAVSEGLDPNGEVGREVCALHRQWLMNTWPSYTSEAHKGVAMMYVCDERFTAYYDAAVKGCAKFLSDSVAHWA